jgi:signal transduction histidine kinase/CheY-like chemotaxis protein
MVESTSTVRPAHADEGLARWRGRILQAALVTATGVGAIAYVPSLILSIKAGVWIVAVVDTLAWFGAIALLVFRRWLSYTTRAVGLLALIYVLAVMLIAVVKMTGTGLVWFAAFPVFAAILLGLRAAIVSLAIFAITCVVFAIAVVNGWWSWAIIPLPVGSDLLLWIVNASNTLAVAAAIAIALSTLLRGLEASNRSLADAIAERERGEAERQRLEAQLRQSHKLEAVGRLASGIAHDFNNLLVPILVYTDDVRRELPAGSATWDRLGEVLQSAERARSLVQRILLVGRRAVVTRGPVRVSTIVYEVGGLLRAAMPSMIEIRYAFETPQAVVLADPAELHQVIMNLGTNAAYAMRETGGRLIFHLDQVHDNTRVRLRVIDTGTGMDADTIEHAFEPFFSTKPVHEGSGLGLATVHGIVTGLGGEITLTSEPGHGTTVEVLLPRAMHAEPAAGTPTQEPALAIGAGQRVLVVDDEPSVLAACQQLLTRLNYEAIACDSPERALDVLRQQPASIDLLLTDQAMPGMSGPALAEAARRIRPDLPILVATGFLDEHVRQELETIGVDQILSKPYTLSDLSAALRAVIEHRVRR